MRAVITGTVIQFRYVELKSGKVGQIDILQNGDDRKPSKVIQLFIPHSGYCRLILEHLRDSIEPFVTFLCWLTVNKEIEIEVQEMLNLSVLEGSSSGTEHGDNT